jgi:hypothetical protein
MNIVAYFLNLALYELGHKGEPEFGGAMGGNQTAVKLRPNVGSGVPLAGAPLPTVRHVRVLGDGSQLLRLVGARLDGPPGEED